MHTSIVKAVKGGGPDRSVPVMLPVVAGVEEILVTHVGAGGAADELVKAAEIRVERVRHGEATRDEEWWAEVVMVLTDMLSAEDAAALRGGCAGGEDGREVGIREAEYAAATTKDAILTDTVAEDGASHGVEALANQGFKGFDIVG